MTILCLALGNPVPNVKLYVGGHFVREDLTRHMVTTGVYGNFKGNLLVFETLN